MPSLVIIKDQVSKEVRYDFMISIDILKDDAVIHYFASKLEI